jgi:hypothetical protein
VFSLGFMFRNPQGVNLKVVRGAIVGRADQLTIPDWTIGQVELDLSPVRLSEGLPAQPAFAVNFEGTRATSHYVVGVLLPLIALVMMSWTVFWAPPTYIAVQFGFAATSILTLIAYRFALASQVPPLTYTTRLDDFLNGAFVIVLLALVEVIVTSRLIYREKVELAERVDGVCRWAFPLALALITVFALMA